jgi:nitrogen fixation/metabolism regulation signal transduction histidine kinase
MGSEAPEGVRSAPSHERRVFWLSVLAGLPGSALGMLLLWLGDLDLSLRLGLSVALVALWLGAAHAVRRRVARSLGTLANLLSAIREGDYSLRGRLPGGDDALGLAYREINELGDTLQAQRLGALEATALLRRVLAEVEVGIFAFDALQKLRVVNHHGERMLDRPAERLHGSTAPELGLADCLEGEPVRTVELPFPRPSGRWLMRRSHFRQGGQRHQLLVLSDASRALREEEHEAWRRLVRVLSHEINNSLAPISSVAGSLEQLQRRDPRPPDWEDDLRTGLLVIAGRSEGLRRIMASYARLAKLPPPRRVRVRVSAWIRRVAEIERRLRVEVSEGPELELLADGDQLDQLLINLVGNAVDASLETRGGVRLRWERKDESLHVFVEDDGPGLSDSQNLFVPFFTTKPEGSGIGLALCRQIAEGHGGALSLANRRDAPGCRAELRLPLAASHAEHDAQAGAADQASG